MKESNAIRFTDRDQPYRGRLLAWHRRVSGRPARLGDEEAATDAETGPRDRASGARLRRCRAPGDALFEEAFQGFVRTILPDAADREAALRQPWQLEALGRAAILAASVREVDLRQRLARQMVGDSVERPRVSRLRARALAQCRDPDEALERWRRLLPLIQGVNLPELADLLAHWSERDRRDLAFAYFAALAGGGRESEAA